MIATYPQYLQLFAVGLVWVNVHCAGMCGPVVVGLDLGALGSAPAAGRLARMRRALVGLVLYQLGRSITYALLGALAGCGGLALQQLFGAVTRAAGLVMAAALVGAGLVGLLGRSGRGGNAGRGPGAWVGRLVAPLVRRASLGGSRPGLRRLWLGMIMGLLPCMIPAWVLGLAASTQSPLHGALLMVILVWMTSGVIFGFGLAPAAILARRRAGRALVPSMLVLSGCWLGLVAAAANGWIGHASLGFTAGNSGYAMMFW